MPTTLLLGKKHEIKDLKARLKARKRTAGTLIAVMAASLLSGTFCCAFNDSSLSSFVQNLLTVMSILLFCLGAVSGGGYGYVWALNRRDLIAILKSDSITTVPILAEYHAYFSTIQNDPRAYRVNRKYREAMTNIRAHMIELLRSGWEASQLEFSAAGLTALIKMMEYLEDADDLHLILEVIAAVGVPDCFLQLNLVARKIYSLTLKDDKQAKYFFLRHVAECKAAIRVRHGRVRDAQSLLRASDAPDTLLRPAYPRLGWSYGEDLLRPSAEQALEEGEQRVGTET